MKFLVLILSLFSAMQQGLSQDSLFITNHYAVAQQIQSCRYSSDKLKCMDSLIKLNSGRIHAGKNYRVQDVRQKKAVIIYNINAGWISLLKGNCASGNRYFAEAEKHISSLKEHYKPQPDMESIERRLHYYQHEWCYRTYHADSTTFFACNCARFFPELNKDTTELEEETEEIIQAESKLDTPSTVSKRNPQYGKLIIDHKLRIDPQLTLEPSSTDYFNKNKSLILKLLSEVAFSEMLREISYSRKSLQPDTLIIKLEINPSSGEISKKCTIVRSTCDSYVGEYYLNAIINMNLSFTRDFISIYIPIIIESLEPDGYYNLDQTILGDDHFLIRYEKLRPIRLH